MGDRSRVPSYWIVDLDARLVEAWTPTVDSPIIVDERLTWQPDRSVAPLAIDLARCFGEI